MACHGIESDYSRVYFKNSTLWFLKNKISSRNKAKESLLFSSSFFLFTVTVDVNKRTRNEVYSSKFHVYATLRYETNWIECEQNSKNAKIRICRSAYTCFGVEKSTCAYPVSNRKAYGAKQRTVTGQREFWKKKFGGESRIIPTSIAKYDNTLRGSRFVYLTIRDSSVTKCRPRPLCILRILCAMCDVVHAFL